MLQFLPYGAHDYVLVLAVEAAGEFVGFLAATGDSKGTGVKKRASAVLCVSCNLRTQHKD